MSEKKEKLPAHELLVERLTSTVERLPQLKELPYSRHDQVRSLALADQLINLLANMFIPEAAAEWTLNSIQGILAYSKQHEIKELTPLLEKLCQELSKS